MGRVLAVLKGYFDDSKSDDQVLTVAGFIGDESRWEEFERLWPRILALYGVDYFHMKEMGSPTGHYSKWHPPMANKMIVAAFLRDLARVVGFCDLAAFSTHVRLADLRRFNMQFGTNLDAFGLAIYMAMIEMMKRFPDQPIEAIFDRADKVRSKIDIALSYGTSDWKWHERFKNMIATALPENIGFKKVIPIQAADYIAWETRRHIVDIDEWFGVTDRPIGKGQETWEHLTKWAKDKFGADVPVRRKSLLQLANSNPIKGVILDFENICIMHKMRKEIWSVKALRALNAQ